MAATNKTWLNNQPPACEDDDLNGFKNENNNLILGSGQSLDTGDLQQTHKAVADYAGSGAFYTDSGVADAYVLSPAGAHVAPPAYTDGMKTEFLATNTNAGASTVNVAGLGIKNIVNTTIAGTIISGERYRLRYRSGSGDFEIIGGTGYGQTYQTVTRTSGVTYFNTTGKPIFLCARLGTSDLLSMTIGALVFQSTATTSTNSQWESYVIPVGASYVATYTGGVTFEELR